MAVTELLYCDFIVWTPCEMVIVRIQRNQHFIDQMRATATEFWLKHVLKSLTSEPKLSPSIPDKTLPTTNMHYCVCKSTSGEGEMIGCDKCDNWYHPSCLKLKRLPKAKKWYCPDCKNNVNRV